jgi:hypothetical protein
MYNVLNPIYSMKETNEFEHRIDPDELEELGKIYSSPLKKRAPSATRPQ